MAYTPQAQSLSPYEGAGGKAIIGISAASLGVSYTISVRTQPIAPPGSVGAPNDWTYPVESAGVWQFLTEGGVWGGSETGVIETLDALLALLKTGYGSDFTLSLLRLHHWDLTARLWRRCSPFPTVPGVTGTFGTNPSGATAPELGNVTTISLPTYQSNFGNTKVGRMSLRLPAWELNKPTRRVRGVTGSTGASGIVTANVTALVAYLAGSATRIVGHNGGQADNIADIDVAPSPRIARAAKIIS